MSEAIEGYKFLIDLDDRGTTYKLSQLAKEATTLKNVMRANFNENMSLGNSYMAFGQKITDAHRAIEGYNLAIQQAQRDIQNMPAHIEELRQKYQALTKDQRENSEEGRKLSEQIESEEKRRLSNVNAIERYRNQISMLNRQIAEAERQQQNYNGVLERYRLVSSGMSSAMSSYNQMLEKTGMGALNTKTKMAGLRTEFSLMQRQYSQEVAQTSKLQSKLSSLQRDYTKQVFAVRKAAVEHGKTSDKYKEEASELSRLQSKLDQSTADMQKQVAASSKAAASVGRLRSAINSVGTGRLGVVSRAFNNIDTRVKVATTHTRAYASSLKSSFMGVGIGVAAFGVGIGKAVSMSAQLQNSWITTKNLLQTGAKNAAEAREEVGKLSTMERDARNYSREYGYSQKEIADQYTTLVKRGYSAGQSIGSMKSMLEAARASGDDYADVVDNVSNVMDSFGLRQNKTASQVVANSKRVTNAMAYAADMTATNFKNMGEALKYVSASASQTGQSVETTTAALGELSNAGLEGSIAGTGLRKVFNSLIKPTKGASEALNKYGLTLDSFKDKKGNLMQLPDIMKTINKHLKDAHATSTEKGAFFKAVFGATGQQAAQILSQNADAMQDLINKEKDAEKHNYVHRLAEKNMASTQMQLQKLKTNVQDIAINLGNKLLPAVNKVTEAFSKWVGSKQGQKSIETFGNAVADAANSIAAHSGAIFSFVGGFTDGLIGVVKPVATVVGAIGKFVGAIGKMVGLGNSVPHVAGAVIGAITGIIAVFKILHTAISGVNAVKSDLKGLGVMKDESAQLNEQNRLYERMIALQERSLEISEAQAKQQGIDTESLERNAGKQDLERVADDLAGTNKGEIVKDVKVRPYLDETRTSRIGQWFKNKLPSFGAVGGAEAGTKATTGFLGKLKRLPGLIKGAGIFGKIMDFGMNAFAMFDMSKSIYNGLTNTKAKGRYQSAGKAIAQGVGMYLGGPMVSQFAGYGMEWAYKAVDSFKKGWNGYTKGYKPKGLIATVGWDFKDATRKYNNWIASIEKKHPIIAGYFRWERGTFTTAFATIKFFMRNIHAGFKEMWDTIADLGTLNFSKWKKDELNDAHSTIHGVKNDWKGFFGWFTQNRKKVTIHKPTKRGNSTSSRSSSSHTFKSSGNVKYSKSDVANLKDMTKAIGDYKSALKGLKSFVKSNDPSKQMNSMVKNMSNSVKGWERLAKPIKRIGDAFKTLAKFTSSMAKYDAFEALNRDLPKLDSTLKDQKIGKRLKDLGDSIKNSHVEGRIKSLTREVKSDTSKWKDFAKPVKTVGAYMKDFAKAMDSLAGKGSSLSNFITLLPQLSDALSKNDIAGKIKSLANGIKKSGIVGALKDVTGELKSDLGKWKDFAKPVKTIGGYMKDFEKSVSSLGGKNSALANLTAQIPDLQTALTKNDIGGKIKTMAGKIRDAKLDKALSPITSALKSNKSNWGKLSDNISSMASALKRFNAQTKNIGGKKDPLEGLTRGFKDLQSALKKNKIGDYLKNLNTTIKKNKIDKTLSSMNKSVQTSAKNWKTLSKPLASAAKSFRTLSSAVKGLASSKKSGFEKLTSDIKNLYQTIRKYPFGKQIASQASIANNAMSGKKAGFVGRFTQATNQMTKALRNFGRTFDRDWKDTWRGLASPVERALSSAVSAESSKLNSMEDKRADFSSTFLKGWHSWIDEVVSSFKSGFSKIPEYASSAMKDIVSRLNKGISGINAVIGDFGGDKKLSSISYADGTRSGGHPGGHMLVNDSHRAHWKELVKFPGKPWTMFKERNTFIPNAPAGTQVLNGEMTHSIMSAMGVHRYANGTLSDEEQEKLSEEFENNPKAASKELVLKLTNWNSNVPVVADLGQAMAVAFSQGIANVLKDLLGEVKEPVNGDWTPVIKSAAAKMGVHLTADQIGRLLRQIQTESGGDEKVTQHVQDINSAAGHPAQGLLQFIPSTFNTWAMPGHHNILSGFDQIMAAINALNHGGEGGWGNIGNGHGWATGGIVGKHGLYEMAEGDLPEAIIPLDINKRPRALSIINNTLNHMERDGGGTGNIRRGDSYESTEYLKQAVAILGQIAGLNAQQIDAIMSINPGTDMKSRRARSKFYNNMYNDQAIRDYQSF